ncbi:MAG: hypothetical protein SFV54_21410 [Bryobacteraceae bacterium]|nr:hypothetical protein [Bryobacteraceae bacterium]
MRASFLLLAALPLAASTYTVVGDDPGPWPGILSSVGFGSGTPTRVFILTEGAKADPETWLPRIEQGAIVVLEGDSPLARALGFLPSPTRAPVQSIVDEHRPKLPIVWERPVDLPTYAVPETARVFVRERWKQAPLTAGLKKGQGAVLWIPLSPGTTGHERFPYLLHALAALGAEPPVDSRRLWAFFDSSYRSRVDVDYFAARWRKAGIAALHVAAWHYWEPDPARDAWLRSLIAACHRRAIAVYAWLELPHVSEQFWRDHPDWREKTALGQDAHLDWRKLMNLANPDCSREVEQGARSLLRRFDWDGANLGELYFESLEGAANPARFTPFNPDVLAEFKLKFGYEANLTDPGKQRAFLDYRAALARRLQTEWIARLESAQREKPWLDLVLTHIDDRFDSTMRDKLGADAAALLQDTEGRALTFLIEDPATVWHLGADRYAEIRKRYEPLTARPARLAIDLNIVERYQDVYPTKQQTGTELFQLVNVAARMFPRVALYFESSILAPDLPFLPAAAAGVTRLERTSTKTIVDSPHGAGLRWRGPALVNGRPWPVADGETVWLPPGIASVEAAPAIAPLYILDCNARLSAASVARDGVEFTYESRSRAYVVLERLPRKVELDGAPTEPEFLEQPDGYTLVLPKGQHLVTLRL